MTNVKIRALAAEDRADWARLWAAYLTFYETARSREVYDTTFARLLSEDAQEYSCLLAESAGHVVGLTHFLFHRHCWSVGNTCYLQDLFVAPEARGTGAGAALIEAVYAAADANEDADGSVYWTTQHFNAPARKLYDRIGSETPFIKYSRPTS